MRTAARTTGWVGLLLTLGLIAALVAVLTSHPRDVRQYVRSVHLYGGLMHRVPAEDMPADQSLVSVGDRACAWLSRQEPALWRRDNRFQLATRAAAYSAASNDTTGLITAGLRPESVYLEAWTYLCPGTQELIEPHYRAVHGGGD
jgi:hypothetical protein